jgi:S1-C subfamily serine protease
MRPAPWCLAIVAALALLAPRLYAADDKKDEEAKGKLSQETRKRIQEKKFTFGAVILEVTADGPATKGREKPKDAGDIVMLEEGDIITHVDGKEVKTADDFYKLMGGGGEKKITVINVQDNKPISSYFKPKGGKLGIKFEMISTVG